MPQLRFLLLWLVLPNVFFLSLAWLNNLSRPLLNTDYLFGLLLLLLPYTTTRTIAIISLLLAALLDAWMLGIQVFPFLDVSAMVYLAPFIATAPTRYVVLIGLLALFMLTWLLFCWKTSHRLPQFYGVASIMMLLLAAYLLGDVRYNRYGNGLLGRNNYYLAHSVGELMSNTQDSPFQQWMSREPQLQPLLPQQQSAQSQLQRPHQGNILYIVAESLGMPRTPQMQALMLQNLPQAQFEFFKTGQFDFNGSTVQAELRELCQLNATNGYAFRHLTTNPFLDCLPNQLKQQGYRTVALHGATSILYDRHNWYTKAGFQSLLFNEHLLKLPRCSPFKGACDSALTQVVIDEFGKPSQQPLFMYWLTLTSHSPFDKDDIHNPRFDCAQFNMRADGDICRSFQLQTQFFDDLGKMLQHPNMQGTEVVIVGDHMPPLMGNEPIHPFLKWQSVIWLHFKVKASS